MPDINPPTLEAWRLFLTAHHEVIDTLSRELERETGLPLTWYEVLLYLKQAPDRQLRMHELAESLLLSRSAMTRFVDRIERAGYVPGEQVAIFARRCRLWPTLKREPAAEI